MFWYKPEGMKICVRTSWLQKPFRSDFLPGTPTTASVCWHFTPTNCFLNRFWCFYERAERGEKLVTVNLVLLSQLLDRGSPVLPVKHYLPANGIDFLCKYLPCDQVTGLEPLFPPVYKANKWGLTSLPWWCFQRLFTKKSLTLADLNTTSSGEAVGNSWFLCSTVFILAGSLLTPISG